MRGVQIVPVYFLVTSCGFLTISKLKVFERSYLKSIWYSVAQIDLIAPIFF